MKRCIKSGRFWRNTGDMAHRNPARSRQCSTELLGLVLRGPSHTIEHWNAQTRCFPGKIAQSTPIGRIFQLSRHLYPKRTLAILIQQHAKLRNQPQKRGRNRAFSPVPRSPRTQDRIGIDHRRRLRPRQNLPLERHIAHQVRSAGKSGDKPRIRSQNRQILLHLHLFGIILGHIHIVQGHKRGMHRTGTSGMRPVRTCLHEIGHVLVHCLFGRPPCHQIGYWQQGVCIIYLN